MKSCIIGAPRSRTTALMEKLRINYSYEYVFNEYYHRKYHTVSDNNNKFKILTDKLFEYKNFLVKIISNHFIPCEEDNLFEKLRFKDYDTITLIERPNFFDQCCSLNVAYKTNVWHQTTNHLLYNSLKKQKFFLEDVNIYRQILGVDKYIEIKQHLIDKNISFVVYDYENFNDVKLQISDPKLNYSELVTNYSSNKLLNNLFEKHFNYDTCKRNLQDFFSDYNDIKENFIEK